MCRSKVVPFFRGREEPFNSASYVVVANDLESLILAVYVVITGSDRAELKQYLSKHFHTKDLGKLRDFLGIEVARSKAGTLSEEVYLRLLRGDWIVESKALLWIRM